MRSLCAPSSTKYNSSHGCYLPSTAPPPTPNPRPPSSTCVSHGCIHGRLALCRQRGPQQVKRVGGHGGGCPC